MRSLHSFFLSRIGLLTIAVATSALVIIPPPSAHAQTVVYTNGSGLPDGIGGFYSDPDAGQYAADDFTFSSATSFNQVNWFGSYNPANTPTTPDNFTIAFYNTTAGTPNTTPIFTFNVGNAVNRVASGGTTFGDTNYSYSSVLAGGVSLGPGTYGISIFNELPADNDDAWVWLTTNQTGTNYYHSTLNSPFFRNNNGDFAFSLINIPAGGEVPEPGTLALLGIGSFPLVGLITRRKLGERFAARKSKTS